MDLNQQIHAAADYILARVDKRPTVGMILGSGLGDLADSLENKVVIPYEEIPHFPRSTVEGHAGALVVGEICGKTVAVMQGRVHYYEGYSQQLITMPVRVMKLLGVECLVLTNAAGGVNLDYKPGDLMLISDHINFSGSNPLVGGNLDEFGPRFPDASDVYTESLRHKVMAAAEKEGIELRQGVYMMFSGPSFETPAEIRMARVLGADAVGMSTVPEALVAAHCGMDVIGVSCISNMAAGILPQKLTHQEVLDTGVLVHDKFCKLVKLVLDIMD